MIGIVKMKCQENVMPKPITVGDNHGQKNSVKNV
jgi:hypothetical protein